MYEYDNNSKLDSVEVTLAMGCRLNCKFCPQGLLLKEYFKDNPKRQSIMSFDDFKTICSKVKNGGTICFSGMCEAFHNPKCTDMILYAYEKGYKVMLLTTLMGVTKEDLNRLKDVKFDGITLHIPDEQGNSKFVITKEYLEVLKMFQENFEISSYSCHGEIHPEVKQYVDKKIAFSNEMMDRAGNLDIDKHFSPKGEIVCMVGTIGNYGNWTPEILPDGTVVLCCMDYGMKHVLGNILSMSVDEILNGNEYKKVLKGMRCEGCDVLCRKCSGAIELKNTPAYKFWTALNEYRENSDTDKISDKQKNLIKQVNNASVVCIYGLGKLFWNNFFNQRWSDIPLPYLLCDSDASYHGKTIKELKCISVNELANLENVLVIVHVSNIDNIKDSLSERGITNIIGIRELYNLF